MKIILNTLISFIFIKLVFAQNALPFNSIWINNNDCIEFHNDSLVSFYEKDLPFSVAINAYPVFKIDDKYIIKDADFDIFSDSIRYGLYNWVVINRFNIIDDTLFIDYTQNWKAPTEDYLKTKNKKKEYSEYYINRDSYFEKNFKFDSLRYKFYPYEIFIKSTGEFTINIRKTKQNDSIFVAQTLNFHQLDSLNYRIKRACPSTSSITWKSMLHSPNTNLDIYSNNKKYSFEGGVTPTLFRELCWFLDGILAKSFKFNYNLYYYGM